MRNQTRSWKFCQFTVTIMLLLSLCPGNDFAFGFFYPPDSGCFSTGPQSTSSPSHPLFPLTHRSIFSDLGFCSQRFVRTFSPICLTALSSPANQKCGLCSKVIGITQGAGQKCRISGPIPDPLSQNLYFNKTSSLRSCNRGFQPLSPEWNREVTE